MAYDAYTYRKLLGLDPSTGYPTGTAPLTTSPYSTGYQQTTTTSPQVSPEQESSAYETALASLLNDPNLGRVPEAKVQSSFDALASDALMGGSDEIQRILANSGAGPNAGGILAQLKGELSKNVGLERIKAELGYAQQGASAQERAASLAASARYGVLTRPRGDTTTKTENFNQLALANIPGLVGGSGASFAPSGGSFNLGNKASVSGIGGGFSSPSATPQASAVPDNAGSLWNLGQPGGTEGYSGTGINTYPTNFTNLAGVGASTYSSPMERQQSESWWY